MVLNIYIKLQNRKLEIQKKYAKARDYMLEKINYFVEKKMH